MKRKQGLSFCEVELDMVKKEAIGLYEYLEDAFFRFDGHLLWARLSPARSGQRRLLTDHRRATEIAREVKAGRVSTLMNG